MDKDDAAHWEAVEEAAELMNEERFHEALTALRDVLGKDPKNPYAFFLLGQALYEVGEIAPARDAYRATLVHAPKHLGARIALTHVLRKLGEHRDAIKEGMAALDQAPADPDALYALGLAYAARGENPAARRYLEAFLKAGPDFEVKVEVEGLLASMDGAPIKPN